MSQRISRREFVAGSVAAGTAMFVAGQAGAEAAAGMMRRQRKMSPNEKLNVACIGVANQGAFSLYNVNSQNVVALCDINDDYLAAAAKDFPQAKTYNDFRKLLDQKDIDAVTVGTPDHIHAIATISALKSGRHVYCEKPLTHDLWECRQVEEETKKSGLATQMGTQIHAGSNYRRVVEVLQSGAIGTIREVHVWVGSVWSGPGKRPTDTPPVPKNIHWDTWIGPAPDRPYNPIYIPARWRGWWDFGGGGLADMACHHIDLSHWALNLSFPLTVEAEGPPVNDENAPEWLIVHYEYPARGEQPPVSLTWYNGDKRPHYFAEGKLPEWGNGSLFIGDKGMMLADYDRYKLLPEKDFEGYQPPPKTIPDSIGHHNEWILACKTGSPTTCNFQYSGLLTEAVHLGNVAYRTGKKLEWDSIALKVMNCPEAEKYMRRRYRRGWHL